MNMTSSLDDAARILTGAAGSGDARLFIGGTWCDGVDSTIVPDRFHGVPFATVQLPSGQQVTECVQSAHRAFRGSALEPHARGAILDRVANLLEERSALLQKVVQAEAGFTQSDAAGELRRCIATLRLSAEEARNFCGKMVPLGGAQGQDGRIGFTMRVPLGVVCAITPFNSPLNTVTHKVGPAIAAGNAVVLKPSLHTPMSACLLASAFLDAGLPAGLLSVLHGGAEVVQWLLTEPLPRFYAFTGSTEVGRVIQQAAGLRRTQMELGSIAHCIVCDDAALDTALPKIVSAAYRKAGQVCTSIQVLLVHESIVGGVTARLSDMVAALAYGDPSQPGTVVGPVITPEAAERIDRWIKDAVGAGGRRLAGGPRRGALVPPTLLADVPADAAVLMREVFGPVMSIVPFRTLDEAIDRINATPYGLASGVFTNRLGDALAAVRRLEVGGVHINETSSSRVDMMPYGGTKDSGFGREGPHHAVREMSEEKMVTLLA